MPRLYNCEKTKCLSNIENEQYEKRGKNKPSIEKTKKLNFKTCKKNTINSLNEVECFLRNFHDINKYLKLYKILK